MRRTFSIIQKRVLDINNQCVYAWLLLSPQRRQSIRMHLSYAARNCNHSWLAWKLRFNNSAGTCLVCSLPAIDYKLPFKQSWRFLLPLKFAPREPKSKLRVMTWCGSCSSCTVSTAQHSRQLQIASALSH